MTESPPKPRSRLRLVLQLLGFLVGIAMLGWCIQMALSDENREGLARLGDADASSVLGLLGVTLVGFIVSGLQFWLTIRPVRRLRAPDVLATNAIAIFLSYLPFKLSVMFRLAVHKRRDGVPIALIGPWFGAIGIALFLPVFPIVGFSMIHPEVDAVWLAVTLGGTAALAWIVSALSRAMGGERGLRAVQALADKQPVGLIKRAVRTDAFRRFDEALTMLSGYRHVLMVMGLRVIDIVAFSMRFYIASRIVGTPLSFEAALLSSVIFFFIGVFSPIGSLGAREAGTAGLAGLLAISGTDFDQIALIMVVVTGAEVLVSFASAAAGIAWLRPDRLLRPGPAAIVAPAEPGASA